MKNLTRRNLLQAGTVGLVGILLSTPLIAESREIKSIRSYREYLIRSYVESNDPVKRNGLPVKIFEFDFQNKKIEIEVSPNTEKTYYSSLGVSEVLDGVETGLDFLDSGIVGKVSIFNYIREDDKVQEFITYDTRGYYRLQTFSKVRNSGDIKKNCADVNSILLSKGLCFAGEAYYHPEKREQHLIGIYEKTTHVKLRGERRQKLKQANIDYLKFLRLTIDKLEQEGKFGLKA